VSNQLSDVTARFDALCSFTLAQWIAAGGDPNHPPELVGTTISVYQMNPPVDDPNKMNDLNNQFGGGNDDTDSSGGNDGNTFNDIITNPDTPYVDTENSPTIQPPTPDDPQPTFVIQPPDGPPSPPIRYKQLCTLWTQDMAGNFGFPDDLQAVIDAGGYIAPTQYCITVVDDSEGRRINPHALQAIAPLSFRRVGTQSAAAAGTVYKFHIPEVVRVATTPGAPKAIVHCNLTPWVVNTDIRIKDPTDPTKTISGGRALSSVCRMVVYVTKTPKLNAAQKKLLAKGYTAIAFQMKSLPSKQSREKPINLPYGSIKFLTKYAVAAPGYADKTSGLTFGNKQGLILWIGKITKKGDYTVKSVWPFYKNGWMHQVFAKTPPPKKPGKKKKK
jgi:hypothetical protein